MKGLVITTENKMSVKEFGEPLYKAIGEVVGGYIEIVHPRGLPAPLTMIVNEEGLLKDLPMNLIGSVLYGYLDHGQPIVGDIVFMKQGFVDGEPDIVGLDDADLSGLVDMIVRLTGGAMTLSE